jgi:hypothetical protein
MINSDTLSAPILSALSEFDRLSHEPSMKNDSKVRTDLLRSMCLVCLVWNDRSQVKAHLNEYLPKLFEDLKGNIVKTPSKNKQNLIRFSQTVDLTDSVKYSDKRKDPQLKRLEDSKVKAVSRRLATCRSITNLVSNNPETWRLSHSFNQTNKTNQELTLIELSHHLIHFHKNDSSVAGVDRMVFISEKVVFF